MKPDTKDRNHQRSDANLYERSMNEIYTAGSRGPNNESSDLD